MFISSSGATCSAVIGALATQGGYLAVAIGGFFILLVYLLVSLLVRYKGIEALNKILPVTIVAPITIVIGINLASFIPTYTLVAGAHSNIGILVAIFTNNSIFNRIDKWLFIINFNNCYWYCSFS